MCCTVVRSYIKMTFTVCVVESATLKRNFPTTKLSLLLNWFKQNVRDSPIAFSNLCLDHIHPQPYHLAVLKNTVIYTTTLF